MCWFYPCWGPRVGINQKAFTLLWSDHAEPSSAVCVFLFPQTTPAYTPTYIPEEESVKRVEGQSWVEGPSHIPSLFLSSWLSSSHHVVSFSSYTFKHSTLFSSWNVEGWSCFYSICLSASLFLQSSTIPSGIMKSGENQNKKQRCHFVPNHQSCWQLLFMIINHSKWRMECLIRGANLEGQGWK